MTTGPARPIRFSDVQAATERAEQQRGAFTSEPEAAPRSWRVLLPYRTPPLTSNMERKLHWASRNRIKVKLTADVAKLLRYLRLPKLEQIAVELVYYAGNNRVQDGDNLAPTLKGVIDGIVQAKIIRDDNASIVLHSGCRIILRGKDPSGLNRPRLYLIIKEIA